MVTQAFADIVEIAGARTILAVPMLNDDTVLGAMVLSSGGQSIHRQADRTGAELRSPSRHRDREYAAAK